MQELLRAVTRLVLPVECAGCGRPDVPWCPPCAALVTGAPPRPAPDAAPGVPVWCAGDYAGVLRRLVLAWKEQGRHDLTPLLGPALAGAAAAAWAGGAAPGSPVVLVPVPSARAAVRRRGGWCVAELAGAAARHLRRAGVPVRVAPLVALARTPRDQSRLTAPQRRANLAGAHRAGPGARGVRCLVVDDVTTTGSTLSEAARALTAAGAEVVGGAVLAVTRRGDPRLLTGPGPR